MILQYIQGYGSLEILQYIQGYESLVILANENPAYNRNAAQYNQLRADENPAS